MNIFEATHCFYNPDTGRVYDYANKQNLSFSEQKTLEQLRQQVSPNLILIREEQAIALQREFHKTQPEAITEEDYWYFLEVMPPVNYTIRGNSESFKLCERICQDITVIVAKIGSHYYKFQNEINLSHEQIIEYIKKNYE